jgi:hypothetical protein
MSYTANDKNIIVGAAAFYVSNDQAALPTLTAGQTAITALETSTDYKAVGYTDGGVQVSYEPTYGDVTVDQLLDSARIFKSGMKVTINTTFSEATLENLVIVWGQKDEPTTAAGDTTLVIDGGSLGEAPHERALAFVGPGPRKSSGGSDVHTERLYSVSRAIQTQTSAHDLKRDAATTLPVSFRCLPDSATSAYGKVVDRVLS